MIKVNYQIIKKENRKILFKYIFPITILLMARIGWNAVFSIPVYGDDILLQIDIASWVPTTPKYDPKADRSKRLVKLFLSS